MSLKSKKVFNTIFTAIILLLALPASAILASWNSIPGNILYPTKQGLEKTALALIPKSLLEAKLHFAFLNRRVQEASIALIQKPNDQQTLINIIAEAKAAEITATNLNPEEKITASLELIEKVNQASEQLEEIKITLSDTTPSIDTTLVTIPSPTPTPTPTPTTITTPTTISQTQQELTQITTNLQVQLQTQNLNQEQQKKLEKIKKEYRERKEKKEKEKEGKNKDNKNNSNNKPND